MTTVLNRDSIKVKRDLQKRIEEYVAQYCEALEENFKQYSINSYKRNINQPTEVSKPYTSYYEEQLQKIEDGTANLYKFDYQVGKNILRFLIYSIQKHATIITALLVIVLEVLQHLLIRIQAKFINLLHGKHQQSTLDLI